VTRGGGSGRGRLIAFEGGEACGKSTQAARLATRLGAVLTREPGGTALGEAIRALVLDPSSDVGDRAEALLMAAARAQHVAEVIEPALAAGRHVVTDRWIGSSLAYQGFGRGLPLDDVAALSRFATGGLDADVVVLLHVPAPVAAARQADPPDRMEQAGDGFHRRVAEGFRALAAADGDRWLVVDGEGTVGAVGERVVRAVADRIGPAADLTA
jgi:dTMP kinase